MAELGFTCILLGFSLSLYGMIGSALGAITKTSRLIVSARRAVYLLLLASTLSSVALIYLFVTNDFSIKYVHDHSNIVMDRAYVWVAFYSGNEGSLLYLTFVLTLLTSISIRFSPSRIKPILPWTTSILSGVIFFYFLVMTFFANPFEILDKEVIDGIGINPLLTHPGMFSHPPMLMAGLIGITVPFAFANGALISGKYYDDWVDLARISSLITWGILGTGILLGAWWAYTILGWGGYWSWDPIENVAIMPWLILTAFIHSIMVQKRRNMFRLWNIVLLNIAFVLAQFGTFINRGGPVVSVHSFASSTLGFVFLSFLLLSLVFAFGVFLWRAPHLRSTRNLESFLSREASFLVNNFLLLSITFITLWGVIYPLLSDVIRDVSVTVAAPYFNRVNGPIFLLLIIMMGIGPLLPWRKINNETLKQKILIPVIGTVIVSISLYAFLGIREHLAVLAFSSTAFVFLSVFSEWYIGTRRRMKSNRSPIVAWWELISGNRPRHGGYIVHISIVMIGIGVIGTNFFEQRTDQALDLNQSTVIDDYRIEYIGTEEKLRQDRITKLASLNVYKINPEEYKDVSHKGEDGFKVSENINNRNDKKIGSVILRHEFYPLINQVSVRSGIISTPIEDLYVIPRDFLEDGRIAIGVSINPLAWWIWASGPFFIIGTLIALWPHNTKKSSVTYGGTTIMEKTK